MDGSKVSKLLTDGSTSLMNLRPGHVESLRGPLPAPAVQFGDHARCPGLPPAREARGRVRAWLAGASERFPCPTRSSICRRRACERRTAAAAAGSPTRCKFATLRPLDVPTSARADTRTMLKTSGARESSRIQQRWGEEVGSSCEPPAAGRPAKHLGAKVCSTKRVLLELFVFFVLLLWVVLIALNLASRMEPCQLTRQTVRGDLGNRFIHLKSWNGAAFWYVRTDGMAALALALGQTRTLTSEPTYHAHQSEPFGLGLGLVRVLTQTLTQTNPNPNPHPGPNPNPDPGM